MTILIVLASSIFTGLLGLVVGYVLRILEEKENRK
jgi:ABC-type methionine transport system permease subunit